MSVKITCKNCGGIAVQDVSVFTVKPGDGKLDVKCPDCGWILIKKSGNVGIGNDTTTGAG